MGRILERFLMVSKVVGLSDDTEAIGVPHCGHVDALSEICFLHSGHSIKAILSPFFGFESSNVDFDYCRLSLKTHAIFDDAAS
jgi:hypothetical protein